MSQDFTTCMSSASRPIALSRRPLIGTAFTRRNRSKAAAVAVRPELSAIKCSKSKWGTSRREQTARREDHHASNAPDETWRLYRARPHARSRRRRRAKQDLRAETIAL